MVLRRPLVIKEGALALHFKQGNQVRGALRVKFILSLIGMLNRVTLCVNSMFKSD